MASIIDVLSTVESPVKAGLIKRAIEVSPVLNLLQFEQLSSINHRMFQEGVLPRAAYRDYNAAHADGTVSPDEPMNIQMSDFGLRIPMDPILAMEPTRFDGEYKMKVRKQAGRSIGLDFKMKFVGTEQAETVGLNRGIYQWAKFWNSATNAVRLSMGTNGLKLSGTNGMRIFITNMEKLRIRVRPTFYGMNSTTMITITQMLRETAYTETYANEFTWVDPTDGTSPGQLRFHGIPCIDMGEDAAQADIIGYAETEGSGTTCSSVIAVRSGLDDGVTVVHRFPDLMLVREFVSTSDQEAMSIHMPLAIEARGERTCGRIAGILAE